MDQAHALAALSALANATRLDLVRLLIAAGPDGLAASDIADRLGLAASRLSFHLAALERARLVISRRASRNVFYAADKRALGSLIAYLLNDCCAAHPEVCACCGVPPVAGGVTPVPEP